MKLKNVLHDVGAVKIHGDPSTNIKGISYSSKTVEAGHLFAAMKGEETDGSCFISEAVANGAAAVLSERKSPRDFDRIWIQVRDARESLSLCAANFYGNPSRQLEVVGVTGTKGKTTVVYILEEILKQAKRKPGVISTISYRGPGLKRKAKRTTPESPDLQNMMRKMLNKGATHCIMEVSSHALELKRVTGTEFDVAVFTNLSGDHLDYHRSMGHYFEAKKKLFQTNSKQRTAVINLDDPWGKTLRSQLTTGVMTYGLQPAAMLYGENYVLTPQGIQLTVRHSAGKERFTSPLLGRPNVYNILAATATAMTMNISPSKIRDGLARMNGVPGRFEKIKNRFGLHIYVDYAHTDAALESLLEMAKNLYEGKIILVFGAGGDRDKSKRPRMGKAAGKYADWSIITSDNPRSEDPLSIIRDIEKGLQNSGRGKYEIEPNRKKAIKKAIQMGKRGDVVLVAGKGHENYQIIKNKIYDFDDAEVIKSFLNERGGH